ncbi:hypothetical protein H4CHR_00690 [Variovorax sp. PBS-H4]|nr:hypothetical protein H4CHR_00690 [Variovorax sp. PBS-H4]
MEAVPHGRAPGMWCGPSDPTAPKAAGLAHAARLRTPNRQPQRHRAVP